MIETPRSLRQDGEWVVSVFECAACGIDFFTEDHVPLTGLPPTPQHQCAVYRCDETHGAPHHYAHPVLVLLFAEK